MGKRKPQQARLLAVFQQQPKEPKLEPKPGPDPEQVLALKKQLDSCKDPDASASAAELLRVLQALGSTSMSIEVLKQTKVGISVSRIRKGSSGHVKVAAKQLIRAWRKETEGAE